MSNLRLVKEEEFGSIKCDLYQDSSDEVYMTIKQLAEVLGYASKSGIRNIISRNEYLKNDDFMGSHKLWVGGSTQETNVFTEDGIYEITMLSSKPKAREFRHWIRNVIKELRKSGSYDLIEKDIEAKAKDEKEEKLLKQIYYLKKQIELEDPPSEANQIRLDNLEIKLDQHRQQREIKEEVKDLNNRVEKLEGKDVPKTHCKAYEIAKQIGVTSTSNRPHSQLVGAIARVLGFKVDKKPPYQSEHIIRVYGDNGNGQETYYSPKAVKKIKLYFYNNKSNLRYKNNYRRNSKYGYAGDIREQGYEINGTNFATYKARLNNKQAI